MEILYPVSVASPRDATAAGGSITMLVNRSVRRDEEAGFLATLMGLLEEFDGFSGSAGSLVFRREGPDEVEISILQRFTSEKDHDAWIASPAFARWKAAVAPPEPRVGHVQRYSGLDAFFVTARAPGAPPRWKMAVVLLVAVFPMSLAMSRWAAPLLSRLPLATGALLTSVVMVVSMTWIITPLLTRIFASWLQAKPQ